MKKTIIALMVLGSSYTVLAQEDTAMLRTEQSYNAFSYFTAVPPLYVESYVVRDYPTAADVKWRQAGEWWHGYYVTNGMPTHVYYNAAGQTFNVALPVRQSLVPDAVVVKAVELYGPTVYDINAVRSTDDEEIYLVRILENGTLSSHWITLDGEKVIDVYRIDSTDPMHSEMRTESEVIETKIKEKVDEDDTKTKIKTKSSDGTETKTKIKNGKVKTKVDD